MSFDTNLTPEQEQEAEALYQHLQHAYLDEARRVARLLASKPNERLLGKTEFELRDALHRLGAKTLATALEGRKKGGTKGRA